MGNVISEVLVHCLIDFNQINKRAFSRVVLKDAM